LLIATRWFDISDSKRSQRDLDGMAVPKSVLRLCCCLGPNTDWVTFSPAFCGSVVINLLWAGGCLLPQLRACRKAPVPEGTANFAFVEPERECGPAPFGPHSACTIC